MLKAKQDSRPRHTMLKIHLVPALMKLILFARTYSTEAIQNDLTKSEGSAWFEFYLTPTRKKSLPLLSFSSDK